jgi:hypothetical protein
VSDERKPWVSCGADIVGHYVCQGRPEIARIRAAVDDALADLDAAAETAALHECYYACNARGNISREWWDAMARILTGIRDRLLGAR